MKSGEPLAAEPARATPYMPAQGTPAQAMPASGKTKVCEACGSEFQCFAESACQGSTECWCAAVKTTPGILERLRASYQDCLCANCLDKAAQTIESASL
ncbi:MAG: hypothetical protein EXQ56_13760 [Acidobacteria bacterium]|nr:hypothetical protein [Acidobacteriota bacterium]